MAEIVDCKVHYLTRPHIVLTTHYGAEPQEKSHVILELRDRDGHVGYGEVTPLPDFTGETPETVKLILEQKFVPLLKGRDSMAIADIHQKMDQMIAENHGAKAAVDCAMHDLSAKALNIPLYRLLGGKCNERVAINRHIGIMAVQEAEKLAEQYTAQGYQHIKMKIGTTPEQDASRVLAVREIAGKTAKIRLDANCGYSYTDAVKLIRLLAHCDIEYYEQLLPQWNLKEMSQLRHAYGIRILIDEAANNVRDVVAYAEAGAADAFTLKLCKCGGLYHALRMAAVADAYQMGVVIASTYDTHIGCAHCLQLASALANVNAACDLTTFATQPSMAETCHQLEGMYLYAGAEPGIGVYTMKDFHM